MVIGQKGAGVEAMKAERNKVYMEELGKNGVDEKFKKFLLSKNKCKIKIYKGENLYG